MPAFLFVTPAQAGAHRPTNPDAAGWVPLITPREVELISSRVRNYQYHPIWGALADQLWLR